MSAIRLYILLLVCLVIASAVVHKIQTQHHALTSKHSKHLFGHASLSHQQLCRRRVGMQASVGKLATQEDDYFITGTITVGTPPQSFNVKVDAFFDNNLLLIGANANLSSVKENLPTKHTYHADNSSTYLAVNGNITYWGLQGHKAQDLLNIGSLSATIKSFIVADVVPYNLNYVPIDGYLGLSPTKESYLNVSVVADDLIDQLDKPIISVYVNATRDGDGTGQVTLGAEDTDNCQRTWSYVPAVTSIYGDPYTVHASSAEVTVGGQLTTVNLNSNVTFFPYAVFSVPYSVKEVFINGTGATYNKTFELYTIDCDTTKAPLITLNVGGVGNSTDSTSQKLVLSGADYIRYRGYDIYDHIRYRTSNDICYLGIIFYNGDTWYLGSQVLNNHCISFNYKERSVGFADSKTPKTDVTKF